MLLSQRFDYILISLVIIYYTKCKYEKKKKTTTHWHTHKYNKKKKSYKKLMELVVS